MEEESCTADSHLKRHKSQMPLRMTVTCQMRVVTHTRCCHEGLVIDDMCVHPLQAILGDTVSSNKTGYQPGGPWTVRLHALIKGILVQGQQAGVCDRAGRVAPAAFVQQEVLLPHHGSTPQQPPLARQQPLVNNEQAIALVPLSHHWLHMLSIVCDSCVVCTPHKASCLRLGKAASSSSSNRAMQESCSSYKTCWGQYGQ